MPSIVSSASQLTQLARRWRIGVKAYKNLFDELPREVGQVSGKLVFKDNPDLLNLAAFQECNEQWAGFQTQKDTLDLRRTVRLQILDIKAGSSGKEEKERRVQALRDGQRTTLKAHRNRLLNRGGMLNIVTTAKKPSTASNAKAFIKLCLGQFLEETE